MERKSLYELMNNQIEKLSLNSSFKKLEDFITNDKNSILFIQSLSSVFEVEDIDNIYGISQARARHSAITFLMGMVFSEFGDLYNEISNIIDLDEAYNQKIWLLTSLNHDRGYFSKYLSRKDVNYKKICKYYLFDESNETTLLKCTSNFQEKYKNTLAYTFEEILLYDEFARDFHERDESEEKVDHGILGGIITYDSLIKK